MNKVLLLTLVALQLLFTSSAFAQYTLSGGPGRIPVLLTGASRSVNIENQTAFQTPPYTVTVKASTENDFTSAPVISEQDYLPLAAGDTIRHRFSTPIPILGDTRALSEVAGSTVFFETCVEDGMGAPTCIVRQSTVVSPDPPSFEASKGGSQEGVNLTFTVPTINSELPFEFLRITRIDRIADAGPTNPEVELNIDASDVEVLEDGGSQLTLRTLVDTANTSIAEFTLQQCFSAVAGAFQCGATGLISRERGYRQAVAESTPNQFNDRIRVQWPNFVFSPFFEGYQVTRCEQENPDACTSEKIASTSFEIDGTEVYDDFSAVRGVSYIYTIDACEGLNPNACVVGDNTNIARSGVTSVGLVDQFENDDSPARATVVSESVSQVRSLHTSTDQDWVRVEIAKDVLLTVSTSAVRNQNADTILELYKSTQAGIELIESNDDVSPEQVASFSIISQVPLNEGVYFIKASHFQLIPDGGGDPIIPAPIVPNYRLNITLEAQSRSTIIMVPILDLLLSD